MRPNNIGALITSFGVYYFTLYLLYGTLIGPYITLGRLVSEPWTTIRLVLRTSIDIGCIVATVAGRQSQGSRAFNPKP